MRNLRQVLFLIICLTLILTLTGQTTFPQTYYITASSANARSCPETTCDRVASLRRNAAITVTGTETGTRVSGSTVWLRFTHNGEDAYVHSSLASTRVPTTSSSTSNSTTTGGSTTGGSISTPIPSTGGGSVSCSGATTCSQMNSCAQAQACLAGGRESLDRDNDGVPCESICPGG